MPSGRPGIPTRIKVARGNPGKQRLNLQEPEPIVATAECPAALTGMARELWDEHAPELVRLGLLTVVDRQEFVQYCRLRAYAWAEFSSTEKGAFSRSLQAFIQSSALARQFGIAGPGSRTKLTSPGTTTASKWAGLMKRSA